MNIHISPLVEGIIIGPVVWALGAFLLHKAILTYRWLKRVAKGHALVQWPALWAVSWGLPRLTKDYCHFRPMDGRQWFSPRMEKFRVFKTPEDQGQ